MKNEIFANVDPCETRVAVRESDRVVELHIERASERGVAGGIYKGRVTRVLPGMQAAFVDIGLERAGFLYVSDYRADLDDVDLGDEEPAARRRGAAQRGQGAQIEDLLEEGREILVQVAKEPLGTKGARITSRISLPGRHLVLMPGVSRVGVSRRIDGDRERRRLRRIVDSHRPKDRDLGFIVRTVSHGVSEADIKADIDYLVSLWEQVQKRCDEIDEVPALVYEEPPLHIRILRDLVTHETKQLVVDDADAYGELQEFVRRFMAAPRPRIVHYKGDPPLFDERRIEEEIERALVRRVDLRSGGHLIVDQAEALTAIDVNTGGFVGGKSRNLEETILKTNLEAVREIARQLRLRNIGGLIILDLIDMEVAGNRDKVYRALQDAMREDKARVNLLKISELGLIEMTRKRTRENLMQQLCDQCPSCEGRGYVPSAKTIAYKVMRELPKDARRLAGDVVVTVEPGVAEVIEKEGLLENVRPQVDREIELRRAPGFDRERFDISSTGRRRRAAAEPVPVPDPIEPGEREQDPGREETGEPVAVPALATAGRDGESARDLSLPVAEGVAAAGGAPGAGAEPGPEPATEADLRAAAGSGLGSAAALDPVAEVDPGPDPERDGDPLEP